MKPKVPPLPVQTCFLVKPGDRDTYAELLATLPDLVPSDGRYDATQGRPNPLTLASLKIRARRRVGKPNRRDEYDRRRLSKRRYWLLPPEAMLLLQSIDLPWPSGVPLATTSMPLGTWKDLLRPLKTRGFVPTHVPKHWPKSKPMTRKELKAWYAAYERLYQKWKKENP